MNAWATKHHTQKINLLIILAWHRKKSTTLKNWHDVTCALDVMLLFFFFGLFFVEFSKSKNKNSTVNQFDLKQNFMKFHRTNMPMYVSFSSFEIFDQCSEKEALNVISSIYSYGRCNCIRSAFYWPNIENIKLCTWHTFHKCM